MEDIRSASDSEREIREAKTPFEDSMRVLVLIDPVATQVERKFKKKYSVVDVEALGITGTARFMVFYKTKDDVQKHEHDGGSNEIVDFIYDGLERVGFGKRTEITLVVEFSSAEEVKELYNGDFSMPMR